MATIKKAATKRAPRKPRPDGQLAIPDQLETTDEKVYQAVKLRMTGLDDATIAAQVGLANQQVVRVEVGVYLQRAALELSKERRLEMLALNNARVEALLNTQWALAEIGDTKAAEFCLKAIAQLAKQNNLEALHETASQSSKTIIIPGTSEEMAAALQAFVEES